MSSNGYESSAIFYNALHVGEVEKLASSLYSYLFPPGAPDETTVLDLGCGTGALLAELQRLGITGVGVDISPDMVKVAQTRHPSLEFTASDMSNVRLDREFDLVLCTNDAINYIHPDSREAVFATIARHLNRRGRGYIDFDTETDIVKFWAIMHLTNRLDRGKIGSTSEPSNVRRSYRPDLQRRSRRLEAL